MPKMFNDGADKSVRLSCPANKLEVQDHEYQENEEHSNGAQNNTLLVHPAVHDGHRCTLHDYHDHSLRNHAFDCPRCTIDVSVSGTQL